MKFTDIFSPEITPPADCSSMTEVRAGVDAIDKTIVQLLARRFGYMDAAARIKQKRADVRDEARKEQVLAHVREAGTKLGLPFGVTDDLWELLIERSIAHEEQQWDNLRSA